MALEQPSFTQVQRFKDFEVRQYAEVLVAETTVEASQSEAGNAGFRRLAGYIFGGNRGEKKIAMTAPVTQAAGQKIAMTAPVTQTSTSPDRWVIQFTMPSALTLETLPEPLDAAVTLRAVAPRKVAVLRYSGGWSQERYEEHLATLRAAVAREGLATRGEPTWARYDPPWMPWFVRTNEVQLEVADAAAAAEPAPL